MKITWRRDIAGPWEKGLALDKHTISSVYTGDNAYGHPTFDTTRTEIGQAVFLLKNRGQRDQAPALAAEVAKVVQRSWQIGLIVPMPASTRRAWQPVDEVEHALAPLLGVKVFDNLVVKAPGGPGAKALKNLTSKDEKEAVLKGRFSITDGIAGEGRWNVLLLDDLYHTGASMEAVATVLRGYRKVDKIYAVALTWRR